MGELVTLSELAGYLGLTDPSEAAMERYRLPLAAATDLFVRDCGRLEAPFQPKQPGRTEVHTGRNAPNLWLHYVPTAITTIKIGLNFASPAETINPADATVLDWRAGSREIRRVDGGVFSMQGAALLSWSRGGQWPPQDWDQSGEPGKVQVVYDAAADQPAFAKLAVMRLVALLEREKGSEGIKSETRGSRSVTLMDIKARDPEWERAVELCRRIEV
jgi:hypothetical protein